MQKTSNSRNVISYLNYTILSLAGIKSTFCGQQDYQLSQSSQHFHTYHFSWFQNQFVSIVCLHSCQLSEKLFNTAGCVMPHMKLLPCLVKNNSNSHVLCAHMFATLRHLSVDIFDITSVKNHSRAVCVMYLLRQNIVLFVIFVFIPKKSPTSVSLVITSVETFQI